MTWAEEMPRGLLTARQPSRILPWGEWVVEAVAGGFRAGEPEADEELRRARLVGGSVVSGSGEEVFARAMAADGERDAEVVMRLRRLDDRLSQRAVFKDQPRTADEAADLKITHINKHAVSPKSNRYHDL